MKKKSLCRGLKTLLLILLDIIVINGTSFLAFLFQSNFRLSDPSFTNFLYHIPLGTAIIVSCFAIFHLYGTIWKYAGSKDVRNIFFACFLGYALLYGLVASVQVIFNVNIRLSIGVYAVGFVLLAAFTMADRFLPRYMRRFHTAYQSPKVTIHKNIMIIGAGQAGDTLLHEFQSSENLDDCRVVCFIDDNIQKVGNYIQGVRVVGTRAAIIDAAKKYAVDEIIFAIPSASQQARAEILNICKDSGCSLKALPAIYQLINGEIKVSSLNEVKIDDLLGRPVVNVDTTGIYELICGKTVLVTGGGGSIGSELCRQIMKYSPRRLVIFDIYENNAYSIQMELVHEYPNADIVALIGSVRDTHRINSIFEKYRPEIVFHAAAHKHVPLMEVSPNEAVKNNVFGTLKTVQAADRYGAKKFVLISTDKAVNPTSVMGATKRICEMIVQTYDKRSKTDYVAVRFGNVLGSNGSVIPLFKKQIAEGGPVLVTDPEITRFFMTIPEAVSLVLQAARFASGGEIFVLDMGKPVKILDLAEKLIRLSGYVPYLDIDIKFIGLRPGEKLYEEVLMSEEGLEKTDNDLIRIGKPLDFDEDKLLADIEDLRRVMMDESVDIREHIRAIVGTYHNAAEVNGKKTAEEAAKAGNTAEAVQNATARGN